MMLTQPVGTKEAQRWYGDTSQLSSFTSLNTAIRMKLLNIT